MLSIICIYRESCIVDARNSLKEDVTVEIPTPNITNALQPSQIVLIALLLGVLLLWMLVFAWMAIRPVRETQGEEAMYVPMTTRESVSRRAPASVKLQTITPVPASLRVAEATEDVVLESSALR
jgi:hypothetical protein